MWKRDHFPNFKYVVKKEEVHEEEANNKDDINYFFHIVIIQRSSKLVIAVGVGHNDVRTKLLR